MSQTILVIRQFLSEYIHHVTADMEISTLKSRGCNSVDNITSEKIVKPFSLKIQFDQRFITVCFCIGLSSSSVRLLPQLRAIHRPVDIYKNKLFRK